MNKARIKFQYDALAAALDEVQLMEIAELKAQVASGDRSKMSALHAAQKPWRDNPGIVKRLRKEAKRRAWENGRHAR